jgi:hypothetical protein
LAIEQQTPEVPRTDRIELDAPTEAELCTRGAVKLTHMQLADLRAVHRAILTELQTERQRNEALTSRANSIETELRVLQASIKSTGRREIIVRLIELVIIALVNFAIEYAKSESWANFTIVTVACLVLAAVVVLNQWWPRTSEKK